MPSAEVLQLFDFAEKPLAFAILQKSQSLIVRHLGKAVFEQNRDFRKNQIFATLPFYSHSKCRGTMS